MSVVEAVAVGRRGARGIVIDDEGRLVLIKRTKPGQDPYWTSPGGGVEDTDATVEDALRRELAEELGATADGYQQVFMSSDLTDAGVAIQYFFVARLVSLNLTERYGPEFSNPERGGYGEQHGQVADCWRCQSEPCRRNAERHGQGRPQGSPGADACSSNAERDR